MRFFFEQERARKSRARLQPSASPAAGDLGAPAGPELHSLAPESSWQRRPGAGGSNAGGAGLEEKAPQNSRECVLVDVQDCGSTEMYWTL